MSAIRDAIKHPAQPLAAGDLSHTLDLCSCINSLICSASQNHLGESTSSELLKIDPVPPPATNGSRITPYFSRKEGHDMFADLSGFRDKMT